MPAIVRSDTTKRTADLEIPGAKKAKLVNALPKEIKEDIDMLCEALSDQDFVVAGPPTNRQMLVSMLPGALGTTKDCRDKYQESVVQMLGEVFDGEDARLHQVLADGKLAVEGCSAESDAQQAVLELTETELRAKIEEVQEKEAASSKAGEIIKDWEVDQEEASKTLIDAEAAEKAVATQKAELLEVKRESFDPILAGDVEEQDQKKHFRALKTLLTSYNADVSLVASIENALSKKPDERGEFDVMVQKEFECFLEKKTASFDEGLAALAAEIAEATSSIGVHEVVLQVAQEKKKTCDEAVAAAQAEKARIEETLTTNKQAQNKQGKVLKQLNAELRMANTNSRYFVESIKTVVTKLVERMPPVEENMEDEPEAVVESM